MNYKSRRTVRGCGYLDKYTVLFHSPSQESHDPDGMGFRCILRNHRCQQTVETALRYYAPECVMCHANFATRMWLVDDPEDILTCDRDACTSLHKCKDCDKINPFPLGNGRWCPACLRGETSTSISHSFRDMPFARVFRGLNRA